ncbi:MAG: hypothetical protein IJE05_05480 [Clostridia bacterium]|nr:hypothetical protein [Clostridia bacterium]MBQ6995983.1 hypothetical protein [Lachnospiraceae bacterium]
MEVIKNDKESSSIICSMNLLLRHQGLEYITNNKHNVYFHVKGTNKVIMHVKEERCIITVYWAKAACSESEVILPKILALNKYGCYFDGRRDWIKRTKIQNRTIGQDIIEIVEGMTRKEARALGLTTDHLAETFNEQPKNIEYGNDTTRDSHKYCVKIKSMEELDELIEILKEDDKHEESRFLFKK